MRSMSIALLMTFILCSPLLATENMSSDPPTIVESTNDENVKTSADEELITELELLELLDLLENMNALASMEDTE